jgi:transposase-like protein
MSNPAQYPLDHADKEVSKRSRRRFTASEKARVLEAFEGAQSAIERSTVLRANGVSRSQVRAWQRAVASGGSKGLESRKPGPIPRYDDKDQLIVQLQSRVAQLTREVATATALVELQKKAISIFDAAHSKIDRSCAKCSPSWPSPTNPTYPYDASAML